MKKKLDDNYTRMLRAILNKSWKQHPTKHQLYGHLPPITKTIQVKRTRHARHCWRSRDELISDVPLWTLSHERAKAGRPARTYIQQLFADTGCSLDLPEAMDDREGWWERVRDIRADGVTWWGWYLTQEAQKSYEWSNHHPGVQNIDVRYLRYVERLHHCHLYLAKEEWPCLVCWGCRIHRLQRGKTPPLTSVLDMTLNNLMVRFQQFWRFGECRVPLHYHRSQVHSGPEW